MEKFDFGGYATRNDLLCGDGRTIRKNAFKDNDGDIVPLIYNHDHNDPDAVLGHALLENRSDGVYAYCKLNDTQRGQNVKTMIKNGDLRSLSIYANKLKQIGGDVIHGSIKELSLVLAGANPGAYIDLVMAHGEEEDGLIVNYDENAITVYSSDEEPEIKHSDTEKEDKKMAENPTKETTESKDTTSNGDKTVEDVFKTLNEEQKTAVYALIGMALEEGESDDDNKTNNEEETNVKHNVFDQDETMKANVLTHSDQMEIINLAKSSSVGSLQTAIKSYVEDSNSLSHSIDDIETLFPEYKNLTPGAPELIRADQSWVMKVINKIHKSPYSRIKTRQANAAIAGLRAKGYKTKGEEKTLSANIKLVGRTTEPQTVYRKDQIDRDDIIDITDFDVVNYQWGIMKDNMYEELALAALVGDGREDTDPDKIKDDRIRSIWNDAELYTIHRDVDLAAARQQLQGTNTSANFSENYIYSEAMIMAALYAREQYKGSGTPDYYCAPHSVNVMLLARDLNGRRIYDSKADLTRALNVNEIIEIEQLEGKTRELSNGTVKKLHGIFVNLADYQFGSTKGGELTKFEDFDIDFNQYKYLLETRLSGALTKIKSAIALEETVVVEEEPEEAPEVSG